MTSSRLGSTTGHSSPALYDAPSAAQRRHAFQLPTPPVSGSALHDNTASGTVSSKTAAGRHAFSWSPSRHAREFHYTFILVDTFSEVILITRLVLRFLIDEH